MKQVADKILKKITLKGFVGLFLVPLLVIPSLIIRSIYKIRGRQLWLVCENGITARDNGYIFYKYLKQEHPEIRIYFAINPKSPDCHKIIKLGGCIKWASIKHYLIFMAANENITSHKEGEPNHTIFSILHYIGLFNNRTFLQHGVLYHSMPMFYYKKSFFKVFIAGAKDEYEMIKRDFGYTKNQVHYTGLARFDNLHDAKVDTQLIALIPTWRRWINTEDQFRSSEYYKTFQSLINNNELNEYLEKENKQIIFYPHFSTQKYIHIFSTSSKRIKIVSTNEIDVQDLIRNAAMLVTDYSSIFTDFAYMHKPVVFYQFDYERTYARHYQLPANAKPFHTPQKALGYIAKNEKQLVTRIKDIISSNYNLDKYIEERISSFFLLNDNKNCERIYKAIINSNNQNYKER